MSLKGQADKSQNSKMRSLAFRKKKGGVIDTFVTAAVFLIAKKMGITHTEIKAVEQVILGKWAGLHFWEAYKRFAKDLEKECEG